MFMKMNVCFLSVMLTFLSVFPVNVRSQELKPITEQFMTICLETREAIADLDREAVIECRKKVADFHYDSSHSVEDFSSLMPAISGQEEIPESECKAIFEINYLDSLLAHNIDLAETPCDPHSFNRGAGMKDNCINLCYKAIPANKSLSYTCRGNGTMNLVVIAAERMDIGLKVTYLGESHQVDSTDGIGVKKLAWEMPKESGEITITIENPNRKTITCVIAAN